MPALVHLPRPWRRTLWSPGACCMSPMPLAQPQQPRAIFLTEPEW